MIAFTRIPTSQDFGFKPPGFRSLGQVDVSVNPQPSPSPTPQPQPFSVIRQEPFFVYPTVPADPVIVQERPIDPLTLIIGGATILGVVAIIAFAT